MPFVPYGYLEKNGIMPNRMTLMRAIERHGFPEAVELGPNRVAWDLDEIGTWLASRPRRGPGNGKGLGGARPGRPRKARTNPEAAA